MGAGASLPREITDYDELDEVAISAFQRANNLLVTGRVDDKTRDTLRAIHGS